MQPDNPTRPKLATGGIIREPIGPIRGFAIPTVAQLQQDLAKVTRERDSVLAHNERLVNVSRERDDARGALTLALRERDSLAFRFAEAEAINRPETILADRLALASRRLVDAVVTHFGPPYGRGPIRAEAAAVDEILRSVPIEPDVHPETRFDLTSEGRFFAGISDEIRTVHDTWIARMTQFSESVAASVPFDARESESANACDLHGTQCFQEGNTVHSKEESYNISVIMVPPKTGHLPRVIVEVKGIAPIHLNVSDTGEVAL